MGAESARNVLARRIHCSPELSVHLALVQRAITIIRPIRTIACPVSALVVLPVPQEHNVTLVSHHTQLGVAYIANAPQAGTMTV